jgi:hypothetical protein
VTNKRSKKLPPEVVNHWPEVFEDLEINIVPLEYLHSVRVSFADGKIWDIDLSTKKMGVENLQSALDDLFKEYQDVIENVDFRLDTEKVKQDITQRTKRFLKLRR